MASGYWRQPKGLFTCGTNGTSCEGIAGTNWHIVAQAEVLKIAKRPPSRREAINLAKHFRKHGAHYFRFLHTPSVEPTNNAMERRFRFVVIGREITQALAVRRDDPGVNASGQYLPSVSNAASQPIVNGTLPIR